ncbi:MAG: CRTAC1 family protein, partial [Lentisphaeria bacterium]|nr:CRTAC1 family protein [Lentisphaeria bacterium]
NDGLIDIYYGGGSGHADTMWRQVRVLPIVARYAYKGGTFRQHDEAALTFWTAHTKGKGIRFIFDERRRDNTYIYIHDRARDMTIRLPLTNGMSAYSMDDEKTWHNLYQIHVLPGRSAVPERDEERWMLVASRPGGYCRSVVACDFDEDHDADFYVSNYWLAANFLIVSGDNNKVANRAAAFNVAAGSGHSIGACWGDIDNDGYMDLFAGNFAHDGQPQSRFLRNRGKAAGYKFEDIGTRGVAFQESYASPTLGDYDNDGDLDLFFTTVYDHNAPRLYRNDSSPETGWKFTNVTSEEGIPRLPSTYQAAWGDVNNDGFLDLVTAGRLFINQGNENHWLKIRLKGNGKKVNSSAIGAKVRIKLGEKTLTRQVEGGGVGQGNQNDLTLHFGLGTHSREVDYTVTWTNGETQTGTTGIDRMIRVTMGETE